jgi:uncharacterized protein
MTREVAFAAVKLGMRGVKVSGLLFYGGEPLLERQLIYDVVEYSQKLKKKTGHSFYYKMTTNGVLLDEKFLKFAKECNLTIGFSHDGPVQDICRRTYDDEGSADGLAEKIPLLLKYQPYAVGMSVMDPSTVHRAAETVQYMFDRGFRYLHLSMNYCKTAPWTNEHLDILTEQYKKLAEMYIKWTLDEEKVYFSPFDMKILSHLKGEKYNEDRLRMGRNQPSVNHDGKLYYSSKHLDNPAFAIGDVFSGINSEHQEKLCKKTAVPAEPCKGCALRTRCNYAYDSLVCSDGENISADVTPIQCAHEQLITPIADYVAETLCKKRSALFIHKHYNELYPVMSLAEDLSL